MSIISSEMINIRNLEARDAILISWNVKQGKSKYYIHCPCSITCPCVSEDRRLNLDKCLYVGELDKLFIEQPFVESHGFSVAWHCHTCMNELSCGMPIQVPV